MWTDPRALPDNKSILEHVSKALSRYWPESAEPVVCLPIFRHKQLGPLSGPLRLTEVKLPRWAAECGVDGILVVPREVAPKVSPDMEPWQCVDWWLAAFLLLEGCHERVWEFNRGPIHSYSFRLLGWDERAWQHAWVNRIALFLRKWAIHATGEAVVEQLGPLPKPSIRMTHDVDAVTKTLPIRIKQGAFNILNAVRSLKHGEFRNANKRLMQAARLMFSREEWWTFDLLQRLEANADIKAVYHFYADKRRKNLLRWLFDPGYRITDVEQKNLLNHLKEQGHEIGLHPSFDAWNSPDQIAKQRTSVEEALGASVGCCRQHWLRFSWQHTWLSQQRAGLTHDTTLMFNDRPGFRNSSALTWRPYFVTDIHQNPLCATPSIFMDSHFYDYQLLSPNERFQEMRNWLRECRETFGEAAVLWHPHTLTKDYGWRDGFEAAIALTKEFN